MKNIQFIDSNMFTPKDSWDLLSMAEKSEMMKVAVRNGITNLSDIRQKYNEFAEGGDTKKNLYPIGGLIPGINLPTVIKGATNEVRQRLYDNVTPFGYNNPVERISSAIFLNKPSDKQEYAGNRDILDDLWGTYLGIPKDKRHYDPVLKTSKYKPTNSKDSNQNYVSIPFANDDTDHIIKEALWQGERSQLLNPELGTFTVDTGRDKNGQYVSYYDKWDLNPFRGITNVGNKITKFIGLDKAGDLSFGMGKPIEIYDRIYLDDYYGIPKEYRGGSFLPEVVVEGRKKAGGGNLYDGTSKSSNKMRKSGATGNTLKSTFLDTLNQSLKEDNRFDSSEFRRLFTELADMESSYRPTITNSIGAKGYFQLMPSNRSSSWSNPTQQFHDMYKLVGSNLDYFNKNLTAKDWKRAEELGIDKYGLLAGAHLGGVGNVVKALRGTGNAKDMNGSSVLGYMTKFSQRGKAPSASNSVPVFLDESQLPVSTTVVNPFILPAENTTFFPQVTPVEDNYVEVQEITPEQRRAEQVRSAFDAINSYNRMMDMISVPNNPAPVYRPKNAPYVVMGLGGPVVEAAMNEYKNGGGIHIKPSHRGRLTDLKKRTGKTEAELYNDGNPAHKKMVVFARSARKWKHGLGGNLFSGEEKGSQQMITTHKPYYDRDGVLLYNRTLPETIIIPDSQLSPAERNYRERQKQKNLPDYEEYKDRETTAKQIANAQKEWENSFEKQALNYGQAIASGVGMGADMVSRLPIYSSLKGASTLSRAETPLDYVESGLWLAPIVGETINGTYQAAKPAVENFLVNHPALYQYPRYAIGKFKYGFDAELPTLYRKVKTLPKVENGRVQISNPDNRFAYENGYGEESPIITNFTTDAPVRSHSAGNWDRGLTLAFPGRTLLGKHVISTRPSDTFTFGDNISVPVKDVTAFSGRPKEIASMDNAGVKTVASPDAEMFWGIDSRDLGRRISEARETIQKINAAKAAGNRMILLKPKMPIENFSNYSRAIEDLTRETFKSPTARDYQFMDYVFRPKYDSQIMPVINDITFDVINKYPLMGEWVGNTERLRYLDDPSRWQNLMYDPLTTAESDFRGAMNIGLKPDYKK